MDKLFTKEQANVLTRKGFYEHWKALCGDHTQSQAYDLTEKVHREVHVEGKEKYSGLLSFLRLNGLDKVQGRLKKTLQEIA